MPKLDVTTLPKLIALSGEIGAGKTETARCLRQAYDYKIVSFAGPIKDFLLAMGVPWESLHGTPEQKATPIHGMSSGISGRQLMVGLGTWAGEWLGQAAFARRLVRNLPTDDKRFVIDDLRFPAEYAAVREAGGIVWHVTRGGFEPVLPWDHVIINDGDIPTLYRRVAEAVGAGDAG